MAAIVCELITMGHPQKALFAWTMFETYARIGELLQITPLQVIAPVVHLSGLSTSHPLKRVSIMLHSSQNTQPSKTGEYDHCVSLDLPDWTSYYSGALDGLSATGGRSLDTHLRRVPESTYHGFVEPRSETSGGHGTCLQTRSSVTRQSRAGPHGRRSKAARKLEEQCLDQEVRQVGDAGTRVVKAQCSAANSVRTSPQDVTVRLRAAFRKAVRESGSGQQKVCVDLFGGAAGVTRA